MLSEELESFEKSGLWNQAKVEQSLIFFFNFDGFSKIHCKYIYVQNYIQARVNTVAIPTTGKYCSLYWELLHPILGIPLASIGKLLFIGKLPIEA